MKEPYNSFEEQLNVLQYHYTRRTAANKVLEDVIGWKTHIRDKLKDMPIKDRLWAKKTELPSKLGKVFVMQ